MAEVWIHWSQGQWLVTSDGMDLIEKSARVILRDVRFVIDPLGLQLSRARGRRKTHAWAVGERIRWDSEVDEREPMVFGRLEWFLLRYLPRHGDDHFSVESDAAPTGIYTLQGADYLDADLDANDRWSSVARIAGPRFGETERLRVQQYGGVR